MKTCVKCGLAQGPEEFYLGSNGKPRVQCRTCVLAYEKARATSRRVTYNAWYASNKHKMKERRNAGSRRRYASDPGRLEYAKAYAKAHPETAVIISARRRARLRSAGGNIDVRLWKRLCAAQVGRCVYCRKECKLTIDHIVALSRGGDNGLANVAGCCRSCNDRKSALPLVEFLGRHNLSRVSFLAYRGASLMRLRMGLT